MNGEDRLQRHLAAQMSTIVAPPGDLTEITRRGRRRRTVSTIAVGAGSVLAILAFVAVATMVLPGTPDDVITPPELEPPTETTSVPAPTGSESPIGYLLIREDGVEVVMDDGAMRSLPSDRYYESIEMVIPDGQGGIVISHAVTPMPWAQGSLVWLAPGTTVPTPVAEPDHFPLIPLRVVGGTLYYTSGAVDRVMSVRLDGRSEPEVVADLREIAPSDESVPFDVTVSQSGMVVSYFAGDCVQLVGVGIGSGPVPDIPSELVSCDGSISEIELSPSGATLFVARSNGPGEPDLVVADLAGGEVSRLDLGGSYLAATSDDTVVVYAGELVLVSPDGVEVLPDFGTLPIPLTVPLDLPDDARLGPGTGEIPCEPVEVVDVAGEEPWHQTLNEIRRLAAACDYLALDQLAADDGAIYQDGPAPSLGAAWVEDTRFSGTNPRDLLLAVTEFDPVLDESDVPAMVWPPVAQSNAEGDWAALEEAGVYSSDQIAELRAIWDSYRGFRVVIDLEGRLVAAVEGG
jgi:hypothetical protein